MKDPTYDELMAEKPVFVSECGNYLYIWPKAKQMYENTIWKVNKQTKEVAYMMFTEYIISVSKTATYVVPPEDVDEDDPALLRMKKAS